MALKFKPESKADASWIFVIVSVLYEIPAPLSSSAPWVLF